MSPAPNACRLTPGDRRTGDEGREPGRRGDPRPTHDTALHAARSPTRRECDCSSGRTGPAAGRRLRLRPHRTPAASARDAGPGRVAVHRSRARGDDARALPPGRSWPARRSPRRATAATPPSARGAFDALLAFLMTAGTTGGQPATFLLDEVLELRTFESFPGLRNGAARAGARACPQPQPLRAQHALRRPGPALGRRRAASGSKSSRSPRSTSPRSATRSGAEHGSNADEVAHAVHALVGGQPGYVRALLGPDGGDARQWGHRSDQRPRRLRWARRRARRALPLQLRAAPAPRARLRRAQGDPRGARRRGAADAHDRSRSASSARRARPRTICPGCRTWISSTCVRKRYRFADPLLRLWVRINGGPGHARRGACHQRGAEVRHGPPAGSAALPRSPRRPASSGPGPSTRRRSSGRKPPRPARSGIIEID